MIDEQNNRRRFLVAAVTFAGLASAPIPVAVIRSSAAWANDVSVTGSGNLLTMAKLARRLFPYADLPDSVYTKVISEVLSMTAGDPASRNLLESTIDELDARQDGAWHSLDEREQVHVLEGLQGNPLFDAVLGLVRFRLYNHPQLWELIDYPGSSVEYGGYLDRGFDDIGWLPEVN
jgi:hypothetical protein